MGLEKNRLNVLVISHMFPCKRHPVSGVFFANLMKELVHEVDGLTIVTPRVYIPKLLVKINPKWSNWFIDPMVSEENGMEIIRPYVLSVRGISSLWLSSLLMHYTLKKFLYKLIQRKKVDLILGHNMLPEGIAAAGLADDFNLPVAIICIGTDINDHAKYNSLNFYLTRKSIEKSHLILTNSNALRDKVRKFNNYKLANIRTFYKGIDVSTFNNLPPKTVVLKDMMLRQDKKYILFVGRLIYDKGIYELVSAFCKAAEKHPEIDLLIVGEEFEKDKLVGKLSNLGILDRVLFKGLIPYQEVALYMKASELLVLPTWAEGLPNVVMEAMTIGLPVVATDVGGIPEILEDEVTGLSVPVKNIDALTDAIMRMIDDHELRKRCIKNARKLMVEKFDVKKNAYMLSEMLKEIKNKFSEPA